MQCKKSLLGCRLPQSTRICTNTSFHPPMANQIYQNLWHFRLYFYIILLRLPLHGLSCSFVPPKNQSEFLLFRHSLSSEDFNINMIKLANYIQRITSAVNLITVVTVFLRTANLSDLADMVRELILISNLNNISSALRLSMFK